ncbi:MAG: hypothetical protein K0U12_05545 [Gammaproteobacteria bacterium]|nr:hypothetical protein [Gammaproteobacteria bacterium]
MKKYLINLFISFTLLLSFGASAAVNYYPNCSVDAARAVGMLDAKHGLPYNKNFGRHCAYGPSQYQHDSLKQLNQAYQQGYQAGKKQVKNPFAKNNTPPQPKRQCIKDGIATVCGYHCQKDQFGNARCSPFPNLKCVRDQLGNVQCGVAEQPIR